MLDLLIVIAFVVYSISAGMMARKKASRGLSEYFLAGRGLKGWQAGTSMAATQFAADTPLLVTGLVATGGIFLLWRLWIYGLAFLLMAFLFAGHWQRAGVITDAELTEIRYSGRGVLALRVFKAIYYGTIFNCVVLAWVLFAAVGIAEAFLPWHEWLPTFLYSPLRNLVESSGLEITSGAPVLPVVTATTNNIISILLIVAFTTLYSMTGGLRGVVATDVMQFAIALLGTFVFAWFIVREIGGIGELVPKLVDQYGRAQAEQFISFAPSATGEGSPGWVYVVLPFLTIMSLQWVFQVNSDGTGYLAQRSMACDDEREARFAGLVFAWLQIFLRTLPWLFIAVGLLVVYPFSRADTLASDFTAERELLFVRGINDLLPVGARGLLLTGMLAALASTLDTHMNWGASYWSNDLYKRLICGAWMKRQAGGRELVIVARLSNLVVLTFGLIVMIYLKSIQQAWQIALLFGAGVGSVLILRWIWERINLWSEIAAMLVSIILAPILLANADNLEKMLPAGADAALVVEAINLSIMAIVSTAACIAVTWFTPRTEDDTLDEFYRRVEPAGWWKRSAERKGDDPARPMRELRGEIITTIATGLSLFLCLYGAARLLIPHPEVAVIWPILSLVAGIALVWFWWPRARRSEKANLTAED